MEHSVHIFAKPMLYELFGVQPFQCNFRKRSQANVCFSLLADSQGRSSVFLFYIQEEAGDGTGKIYARYVAAAGRLN